MIQLNYKEARPLYEQIKESIRKMVISNAFLADEAGAMDDYPEAAFFNAGTIDDVKRKAEQLKKGGM